MSIPLKFLTYICGPGALQSPNHSQEVKNYFVKEREGGLSPQILLSSAKIAKITNFVNFFLVQKNAFQAGFKPRTSGTVTNALDRSTIAVNLGFKFITILVQRCPRFINIIVMFFKFKTKQVCFLQFCSASSSQLSN